MGLFLIGISAADIFLFVLDEHYYSAAVTHVNSQLGFMIVYCVHCIFYINHSIYMCIVYSSIFPICKNTIQATCSFDMVFNYAYQLTRHTINQLCLIIHSPHLIVIRI